MINCLSSCFLELNANSLTDVNHPVITELIDNWPVDKLMEPKADIKLIEVAEAILFMLTRPRNVTIRDIVMMPSRFDL